MAELTGEFYIFRRMAQGSRAAPLTFAVIAGVAARFVQSIVANLKNLGPGKRRSQNADLC